MSRDSHQLHSSFLYKKEFAPGGSKFFPVRAMRGSRKSLQRGSNFFTFLVDYGKEDTITTMSGPNGVSLAGRWLHNTECWLVSFFFWFYMGSGPILLRNPIFL